MNEAKLINELSEIVYVSDIETYKLLFINKSGQELGIKAGWANYENRKCYEVLQGRDAPCPFCTNAYLSKEHYYVWEYTNPVAKKHFLLKDKMIDWKGRPARMEIAMDITEQNDLNKLVTYRLEIEDTLVNCIKKLVSAKDINEAINTVLEAVASFYKAERAYICEMNETEEQLRIDYEWMKETEAFMNTKKEEPKRLALAMSLNQREEYPDVICPDIAVFKETMPDVYTGLKKLKIKNFMSVHFSMEKDKQNHIVIENYERPEACSELLKSITYFIITEYTKRSTQDKMQEMLYHDPMTGLFNRYRYLKDIVKIDEAVLSSVGIAFIDINGLKNINDTYGHSFGDAVITKTAKDIKKHFVSEQVYRLSGDEFVVLCPNMDRSNFVAKIRELIKAFKEEDNESLAIGYTWADQDIDIQVLIHQADEQMYVDKQAYYEKSLVKGRHYRPRLREDLINSIKKGEFVMYLQPKANIYTGEITGAEALVRHNHPEKGLIAPGKFIPILEKEHSIKYVDLFIFEEVCKTLEQWYKSGRTLIPVSLNFSRITMMENDIIKTIKTIHQKYDFPKDYIEIEITESVGEIEREAVAEIVLGLRGEGFGISLDDFGTKYTSMSMLTIMDLDVIKLDKSLINSLVSNSKNRVIVKHIIEICREMGYYCIAEGVEKDEQLHILKELNCDFMQGYIVSRPIPRHEFEAKFLA